MNKNYLLFSIVMLISIGVVSASITGGTITTDGAYTIHTFLVNDTFSTDVPLTAEVLVVAGGGGGGYGLGSGGGAGGLIHSSSYAIGVNSYSVVVGVGGVGGESGTPSIASNGGDSIFNDLIAVGGGAGGSVDGVGAGLNGGSGGGSSDGVSQGLGTLNQGFDGGLGGHCGGFGVYGYQVSVGGGGGGAGAVGSAGACSGSGVGGDGLEFSISGTPTYYAGGGGGGLSTYTSSVAGGLGGGGIGNFGGQYGRNGVNGLGSGGGAGGSYYQLYAGGNGGSGVVIIRYLTPVTCAVCSETCSPCGGGCTATDLTNMFTYVSDFDSTVGNISGWDTSCITDMRLMFAYSDFNQDISGWNTSSVTDMGWMFAFTPFNQDISGWDTSHVTEMNNMFRSSPFNQPIGSWNTSSVNWIQNMFWDNTVFNQDISGWDVSNVYDFSNMFNGASSFNQPLNSWTFFSGGGVIVYEMFEGASSFNQNLSSWNILNTDGDIDMMFSGATSFNGDLSGWDTSSVTNMGAMFSGATAFNSDISMWDTSSVVNMNDMFSLTPFNQDISGWDTSSVTSMSSMFNGASSFNQPIGSWDTHSVTDMSYMFNDALAFDQDLSSWDVSSVFDMQFMFGNVNLSINNYDALLNAWSQQSILSNVAFDGGYSMYSSAGQSAHDVLTGTYGWTIYDYGLYSVSSTGAFVTPVVVDDFNRVDCSGNCLGGDWTYSSGDFGISSDTMYGYALDYGLVKIPINFSDGMTLKFRIKETSVGSDWLLATLLDDGGNILTAINMDNGGFMYSNSNNFGQNTQLVAISDGVYYVVELANINTTSSTYDIYVDGNLVLAGQSFNQGAGNSPKFFMVESYKSYNGGSGLALDFNIDYIESSYVESSPPVTCSVCSETCSPCGGGCTATNLDSMYWGVTDFQNVVGDITGWNTSCITNMRYMFGDTDFNQDISGWDMSNVQDISGMFYNDYPFFNSNYNLNSWDISSVTWMNEVFNCDSFDCTYNQPLNNWNTSGVDNMQFVFYGQSAFDQDLSSWDVSNVGLGISGTISFDGIFTNVNLSTSNYDALLNSWSSQSVQSNMVFTGGNSQYSSVGQVGRDILMNTYGWTITDGGCDGSCVVCSENWHHNDSACIGGFYTVHYFDLNMCNSTLNLPVDDNSTLSCTVGEVGRGTGGGSVGKGSHSIDVPEPVVVQQSVLAPVQSTAVSEPTILGKFFTNLWNWFLGLFS